MKSEAFFGFTVSEVMIAMTIIGVIAAMTVPIVVSRYQQQSMLALLKKNYVELQENLLLFYADNFNKNFYQTKLAGSTDDVGDFFKEYYSITTDCGKNQYPSECFNFTYSSIDKSQSGAAISCVGGYSAVVKGGASICIVPGKAKIEEDVILFSGVRSGRLKPTGNRLLFGPGRDVNDDFRHEQSLVIKEGGKTVLFAGCAHCGIADIMQRAMQVVGCPPTHVFAGMHLVKSGLTEKEEALFVRALSDELLENKGCRYFTMHCTGIPQYDALKRNMRDAIDYMSCGEAVEI